MLRRLNMILCCCMAIGIARGQPPASPEEEDANQTRERFALIESRLKMTAQQKEKLRPIMQQEIAELREVRRKHASDNSRRGEINMLREVKRTHYKYDSAIESILTPEQAREWDRMNEWGIDTLPRRPSQKDDTTSAPMSRL